MNKTERQQGVWNLPHVRALCSVMAGGGEQERRAHLICRLVYRYGGLVTCGDGGISARWNSCLNAGMKCLVLF